MTDPGHNDMLIKCTWKVVTTSSFVTEVMIQGICLGVSYRHQHSPLQRAPYFSGYPQRLVNAIHGAFAAQILDAENVDQKICAAYPGEKVKIPTIH